MAGLPLVQPRQHSATVMLNLLGDLWFAQGEPRRHRPGPGAGPARRAPAPVRQGEAKRGRKMGHLNITAATPEAARNGAAGGGLLGIAPF
jgi:5-(carboxyamino)imidazole ribonucleotide synthase